jgi:hypothetical protein
MAKNKLFNEKIFLQRYSSSVIMEWNDMEAKIKKKRKDRSDDYGENFEYLKNKAVRYRKAKFGEKDPLLTKKYAAPKEKPKEIKPEEKDAAPKEKPEEDIPEDVSID